MCILKECFLDPVEKDLLRKVSPGPDPNIILDTSKSLGAVVKFLDLLKQFI